MRLSAPPLALLGLQLAGTYVLACRSRADAVPDPPRELDARSVTASDCVRLEDEASREAKTALERANKSCKADDDCTLAPLRGCVSDCAHGAVSKTAADDWKRERDRVDTSCKKYWAGECPAKAPVTAPSCPPYRAACESGTCVATEVVAAAPRASALPVTATDCRRLYDQAQVEAKAAYDRASKVCKTHDDCALASRRGCLSDCNGSAIATKSVEDYKRDRDRLNATTCKKYWDNDCAAKVPMPTPTCPIYWPTCEGGQCVARHERPAR